MVLPLFLLTNSFKIPESVKPPARSFLMAVKRIKIMWGKGWESRMESSELSNCECANSLLNLPFLNVSPVFSATGRLLVLSLAAVTHSTV